MDALDFDFGVFDEDFSDCELLQESTSVSTNDYTACDTSNELQQCDTTARKRRKREEQSQIVQLQMQFKLPRPRILKNDFRRNYPIMWVNVFNGCDYQQMMLHLNTYYERNVTIQQRDLRPTEIKCMDSRPDINGSACGVPFIAEFWYKAMNVAPDLVCTLKHTFLKVRSDGTSVIKCCFTLTGTKLLSLVDTQDAEKFKKFAHFKAGAIEGNARIDATAAAVAAVAPTKIAAVLRKNREQNHTFTILNQPSSCDVTELQHKEHLPAAVCLSASDSTDGEIASDAVSLTSRSGDSLSDYLSHESASHQSLSGKSAPNMHTFTLSGTSSTDEADAHTDTHHNLHSRVTAEGPAATSPGQLDAADEQELSSRFEELSDLESDISSVSPLTNGHATSSGVAQNRRMGSTAENSATKGLSGALKRKLHKAQLLKQKATEWLSVGQAAFRNGSMESSTGQFVSQNGASIGGSQPRLAAHTQYGNGGTLPQAARVEDQHDAQEQDKQMQQQVVLTAALDCVCSFEMEFNSDSRVTSMVLNYIT